MPLTWILFVIALAGGVYLALAVLCLLTFVRRPLELASEFLPSITILKPIASLEPNLYENLASFCDQAYDAFCEVVFCLHSADDPALGVAKRVVADFPSCNASIAIGEAAGMLNPKIANLAKPAVEPHGDIIVIADSDIRVDREYLRALAGSFASESVGAATCLYAGMPSRNVISRLGALQIEDGFAPSVLVAVAIGKLRFCLGATMAVRRRLLQVVGGLAVLGQRIADDHRLGELVTQNGYEVELSRYVVSTTVAETTLSSLWRHELRWARTNLALAPPGYIFSFLMYALPFALLYLVLSRNIALGLALLAAVVALRLALHYLARRALRVTRSDDAWLIPVRDFLSLAVWAASLIGHTVQWRDKAFDTKEM